MTPAERRAAVDAYWGEGPSTEGKLGIFDKYWEYADRKFAAFQGINVDWKAVRARYRPEIAAGVSYGRFVAIMNQLSLTLRDSHTVALNVPINLLTVPQPGVPLLGVGGWIGDTSGACFTAQDDGSALAYSVVPNHPLGLEPGDRILGYEGRPWRDLYPELVQELPLFPLWWGTSPSSFNHTFVMSAGLNWHLFATMDVQKYATGQIVHLPTSLMPGVIWSDFCSEQMNIPGVPKPGFSSSNDLVSGGIVDGTRIEYIYVWGWFGSAVDDFAAAIQYLTEVEHVAGLILDFRFNEGGFFKAPFRGLGAIASHPIPTNGEDGRAKADDHFQMKSVVTPSELKVDFDNWAGSHQRVKTSFAGPVSLLVGPGALSAGDFGALWSTVLPRVRTFGKSTAMALGLPTQPALGTELNLGPSWFAAVAETNTWAVGAPKDFLIHS
ncbi:MAG: S41 family peptidase, partial [Bryobacteraceae bacterium]